MFENTEIQRTFYCVFLGYAFGASRIGHRIGSLTFAIGYCQCKLHGANAIVLSKEKESSDARYASKLSAQLRKKLTQYLSSSTIIHNGSL